MDPASKNAEPASSERRRAVLMLVLATLYWGLSFPLIKSVTTLNHALLPGAGPWFLASVAVAPRFLLAALVLLAFWLRSRGHPVGLELKQGITVGVFSSAGAFLQTDALQFTDASTSAFLTQFSAILIPAWIALRSRRNPGMLVWAACLLVLVGVGILGNFNWRTLKFGRGEWETLLCSVFFVGQILWIGKKEFRKNRPVPVTLIMFATQAGLFIILALVTAPRLDALLLPWKSLPWLGLTLILTLVCTVSAFSLMTKWQPRISSTEAGLIYCVEPLFAAVFALFLPALLSSWLGIHYPNEKMTWSLIVGGGLITLANVLVQRKEATL